MSATPDQAVGVLGGSFDPVHIGHLHVAEAVRRDLGLARVLLLPAATPPHKRGQALASAAAREAMIRLALAGCSGLELCRLESSAGGVSYTIDTLRRLRGAPPALAPIFVLGADSLRQIHTWKDWRALVREFDLAVVDRPGAPTLAAHELEPDLAVRLVRHDTPDAVGVSPPLGTGGRIFVVPVAPCDVSASAIRTRVARGEPIAGLVPEAVAAYIHRTGIYRREATR